MGEKKPQKKWRLLRNFTHFGRFEYSYWELKEKTLKLAGRGRDFFSNLDLQILIARAAWMHNFFSELICINLLSHNR